MTARRAYIGLALVTILALLVSFTMLGMGLVAATRVVYVEHVCEHAFVWNCAYA